MRINRESKNCPNVLIIFCLICYIMGFDPYHLIQLGFESQDDLIYNQVGATRNQHPYIIILYKHQEWQNVRFGNFEKFLYLRLCSKLLSRLLLEFSQNTSR